jgi:hypothetical protein
MSIHFGDDYARAANIIDMVLQERSKALSEREWKFRLAGYGYSIKETEQGPMITALPDGQEICALPLMNVA